MNTEKVEQGSVTDLAILMRLGRLWALSYKQVLKVHHIGQLLGKKLRLGPILPNPMTSYPSGCPLCILVSAATRFLRSMVGLHIRQALQSFAIEAVN